MNFLGTGAVYFVSVLILPNCWKSTQTCSVYTLGCSSEKLADSLMMFMFRNIELVNDWDYLHSIKGCEEMRHGAVMECDYKARSFSVDSVVMKSLTEDADFELRSKGW